MLMETIKKKDVFFWSLKLIDMAQNMAQKFPAQKTECRKKNYTV